MTSISLNRETSIDLLRRYVDTGFTKTGALTIKEGATVHRYFRVLKGSEKKEPEDDEVKMFKVLFKVLDVLNSNRAYNLEDVAVIDRVITYIQEHVISNQNIETEEPKIREI